MGVLHRLYLFLWVVRVAWNELRPRIHLVVEAYTILILWKLAMISSLNEKLKQFNN